MPKLRVQDFRKPALKKGETMNTLMRTLTITATVCGLVASVCNTLGKSIQFAYSLKEVK